MRVPSVVLACLVGLALRAGAAELGEIGRIALPAGVNVRFVRVSPDGRQLSAACADNRLRAWSLPPGAASVLLRTADVDGAPLSALAYSYDGAWVAAGTTKGAVAVFRARDGEIVTRFQATEAGRDVGVEALAIAPDGSRVAVALSNVPTELWDVASAKRRASLATRFGGSAAMEFSPDGKRLATADEDTAVRLYDADGRLQATAEDLLLESFALTFTPDGKQVAVAGADKSVTLLDGMTGKVVRRLPVQRDPIQWLAALRQGATIVTGSFKEESMRLTGPTLAWPLDGAAPRQILPGGQQFNGGGAVTDGRLLLTSTAAGAIVVWAVR